MDNNIFYYQCELTGALIGLARATEGNESKITNSTYLTMPEGLSVSAAALDKETFSAVLGRLEAEKKKLIPLCYDCASPCGRTANYNIQNLWSSPAKIRALKTLILYGLNGMAVYAYRAALLGCFDSEINDFFCRTLYAVGCDYLEEKDLQSIAMEVGEMNLKCVKLLDQAV